MIQNEEFIREFIEEALAHMDTVENGLLKISKSGEDSSAINDIFRAVHSIKGTAGFLGLKNIVEVSHAMESIFGEFRNGKKAVEQYKVDILFSVYDFLKSLIIDSVNSNSYDISVELKKLQEIGTQEVKKKRE